MRFRVQHIKNVQGKTDKKKGDLHESSFAFIYFLGTCRNFAKPFCKYFKNGLSKLIAPEPTRSAHSVDITSLSRYSLDTSQVAELPQITRPQQGQSATGPIVAPIPQKMNVVEAIHTAVQRRPEISQSISTLWPILMWQKQPIIRSYR